MALELGIVADDFTGACDVAAAVGDAGLETVVLLGVPAATADLPDCGCLVVALKSRTVPVTEAEEQSRQAATGLVRRGARRLFQKYCSTFDSTDRGNIGPVADELRRCLARSVEGETAAGPVVALTTPATPDVDRTVYLGHLFVGDQLLSESPLRDHPLTPMTDSDLVRVLGRQTDEPVGLVRHEVVRAGGDALTDALRAASDEFAHVVVDATTAEDLDRLAHALVMRARSGQVDLWGGASGLAAALARTLADRKPAPPPPVTDRVDPEAPRLILSGSCSRQTQQQVATFRGPRVRLDPVELARDPDAAVEAVVDELGELLMRSESPVALVHSTDTADGVRSAQQVLGTAVASSIVEDCLAAIAPRAIGELGVAQLIVAGGETSAAVCSALGLNALRIGARVSAGVAWSYPLTERGPRVLLKSGNFGGDDMFNEAWTVGA